MDVQQDPQALPQKWQALAPNIWRGKASYFIAILI
jgi:hypothetical protein